MLKEWNEYLEAVHKNKFESDNIRMPLPNEIINYIMPCS